MSVTDLDVIIEKSLRSFHSDICSSEWCGREREMLSLYVFGHLVKFCHPRTILYDTAQIGIEVAVPQLPPDQEHRGRGKTVCKDLVIWPEPKMTMWSIGRPNREPLAVIEWKVIYQLGGGRPRKSKVDESERTRGDISWLTEKSRAVADFIGYAIFVDSTCQPKRLTCARMHRGRDQKSWLVLDAYYK